MGEGALPHEGLALVGLDVGELVDEVRDVGEPLQLGGGHAVIAALQLEDGNHRDEVRVAAALAEAVDRPLHLDAAVFDAGHRVGDGELAVVVAVDAEGNRRGGAGGVHPRRHLGGQRAAARVAEADEAHAGAGGGSETVERVVRVGGEPIEEVLRVEDHLVDALLQERHRVVDDLQVGLERDAEVVPNVQVPGLPDDGHDRRGGSSRRLPLGRAGARGA